MDLDSITPHQYIEKHRLLQPKTTCEERSKSPVSKTSPFKEKHTGPKEMFTRRESVKESSTEKSASPLPPIQELPSYHPSSKSRTCSYQWSYMCRNWPSTQWLGQNDSICGWPRSPSDYKCPTLLCLSLSFLVGICYTKHRKLHS